MNGIYSIFSISSESKFNVLDELAVAGRSGLAWLLLLWLAAGTGPFVSFESLTQTLELCESWRDDLRPLWNAKSSLLLNYTRSELRDLFFCSHLFGLCAAFSSFSMFSISLKSDNKLSSCFWFLCLN